MTGDAQRCACGARPLAWPRHRAQAPANSTPWPPPARWSPGALAAVHARLSARGRAPRAGRDRRAGDPGRGGARLPRLPRLPGVDLRVGQRRRWCTASRRPPRSSRDGDLVSVDCGAILEGWHGDAAVTFGVGAGRPADHALSAAPGGHGGRDRGDAGRRPAHRRLARDRDRDPGRRPRYGAASASSRATAGTASARRCTWTRSCPTRARPARARCWRRAWCWPSNRC